MISTKLLLLFVVCNVIVVKSVPVDRHAHSISKRQTLTTPDNDETKRVINSGQDDVNDESNIAAKVNKIVHEDDAGNSNENASDKSEKTREKGVTDDSDKKDKTLMESTTDARKKAKSKIVHEDDAGNSNGNASDKSEKTREKGVTDVSDKKDKTLEESMTDAQKKAKSTLNTASQGLNKVQDKLTDSFKKAQNVARAAVADQGKMISDSIAKLARFTEQMSQSGLNFFSAFPFGR